MNILPEPASPSRRIVLRTANRRPTGVTPAVICWHAHQAFRTSSGSFAMFAAIRRAVVFGE
jgi:hypothetical protein